MKYSSLHYTVHFEYRLIVHKLHHLHRQEVYYLKISLLPMHQLLSKEIGLEFISEVFIKSVEDMLANLSFAFEGVAQLESEDRFAARAIRPDFIDDVVE